MRTYRIGICCRDPEYASGLMLALNRISGGEIEAMVFSRPEVLVSCLPVHEPELLLMDDWRLDEDEAGMDREAEELYGIPVRRLTEQPSERGIYKYRSVKEICQELLAGLRMTGMAGSSDSGCIAVFSPLGRCGKTALARALAVSSGDRGGLYIGMEEYADCTVHSELLYQIRQRTPEIYEAVVREQTIEDGAAVLRVSGMFSELRDVQEEDLKWLHEQLLQPGRYQRLIYDIGGAALSDLSILRVFERIYMPVLPDDISVRKVGRFRELLREWRLGGLLARITPVEVPQDAVRTGDTCRILQCLEGG